MPKKKTKSNVNSTVKQGQKSKKKTAGSGTVGRKSKKTTTVQWDKDDNGSGKTSMYLLIAWLTEEGNYDNWKSKDCTKKGISEAIEKYFIENGITWRDSKSITDQVSYSILYLASSY